MVIKVHLKDDFLGNHVNCVHDHNVLQLWDYRSIVCYYRSIHCLVLLGRCLHTIILTWIRLWRRSWRTSNHLNGWRWRKRIYWRCFRYRRTTIAAIIILTTISYASDSHLLEWCCYINLQLQFHTVDWIFHVWGIVSFMFKMKINM